MTRPEPTEYAPYFEKYVSLVNGDDIISTLSRQGEETLAFLRNLDASQGELRYAPGKWSIKEVIGHLIDTERIFAYRALRTARNDRTPLPGFDENEYVANSNFDALRLEDLADEYEAVRKGNIYLLKHLDQEAWGRRGLANNNEISVRALSYLIAGHELHHRQIIQSRYL